MTSPGKCLEAPEPGGRGGTELLAFDSGVVELKASALAWKLPVEPQAALRIYEACLASRGTVVLHDMEPCGHSFSCRLGIGIGK